MLEDINNLLEDNNKDIKEINNNFHKINNNNSYYLGDYNKKINSYGKFYSEKYIYHGFWKNNLPHGKGFLNYLSPHKNIINYEGDFLNSIPNGNGKETYINNSYYIGNFKNGNKEGYGKYYINNNLVFDGLWVNNDILVSDEYNTLYVNNFNTIFKKNYKIKCHNIEIKDNINFIINDLSAKIYDISSNKLLYEGGITNNNLDGYGQYYIDIDDNYWLLYDGYFDENKYDGHGNLYNFDNTIYYSGIFNQDNIEDCDNVIIYYSYYDKKYPSYKFTGSILDNMIISKYPSFNQICFNEGILEYKNIIYEGKFNDKNLLNGTNCKIVNKTTNTVVFIGKMTNGTYISGKEYWPNSNYIKFEGNFDQNSVYKYDNGCLYYENGMPWKKGHIINDTFLNGNGIIYYNNGTKKAEGIFYKDLLEGRGKKFYENAHIKSEGNYYSNELHGENNKEYYINGKIKYKGTYDSGWKNGHGILYDEYNNKETPSHIGTFRWNEYIN
tara:strand:- start:449 stop:1939 length:1491 start_codon:yes stop_codon:yes gene_type:complete